MWRVKLLKIQSKKIKIKLKKKVVLNLLKEKRQKSKIITFKLKMALSKIRTKMKSLNHIMKANLQMNISNKRQLHHLKNRNLKISWLKKIEIRLQMRTNYKQKRWMMMAKITHLLLYKKQLPQLKTKPIRANHSYNNLRQMMAIRPIKINSQWINNSPQLNSSQISKMMKSKFPLNKKLRNR